MLLDRIERFNGISISTTNLVSNMDKAFERRFLFKVKINNPDVETRKRIWESRLPDMSGEVYSSLALKYSFSGGEIENVVRKLIIEKITAKEKSAEELISYICDNEKIKSSRVAIGF